MCGMTNELSHPISIGPTDLTVGTVVSPFNLSQTIPTVVDTAFAEKSIDTKIVGVFFAPPGESTAIGELTFGGVDSSKYTGDINYVLVFMLVCDLETLS